MRIRVQVLLIGISLSSWALVTAAQTETVRLYRCKIDGKVTLTDRHCPPGAEEHSSDFVTRPPPSTAPVRLSSGPPVDHKQKSTTASAPERESVSCKNVNGKTTGDCGVHRLISGKIIERSIIQGATVKGDGYLILMGISSGDVLVEKGGAAKITGTVNGRVINNGGQVNIQGIAQHLEANAGTSVVSGIVNTISGAGHVEIRKNAIVEGSVK